MKKYLIILALCLGIHAPAYSDELPLEKKVWRIADHIKKKTYRGCMEVPRKDWTPIDVCVGPDGSMFIDYDVFIHPAGRMEIAYPCRMKLVRILDSQPIYGSPKCLDPEGERLARSWSVLDYRDFFRQRIDAILEWLDEPSTVAVR